MSALDVISAILLLGGAFFFLAGTVGLLRFPDVYTRLHALTKADTLGLGLVLASTALHADSVSAVAELVLIWLFLLMSSSVACQRIAWSAHERHIEPWTRR